MSAYDAFSTDTTSDIDSADVATPTTGQSRPKAKRKPDPNKVWDGETELGNARHIVLPATLAEDDGLTLIHLRIMLYVGRQNPDRGWVEMSQARFAERWGYNSKSVNNAVRQLVGWRYLEKLPQKDAHNRWCRYKVLNTPGATLHLGDGASDAADATTLHVGDGASDATLHVGDGPLLHVADGASQGPLSITESESTEREDSDSVESAQARSHMPQEGADLFGLGKSPVGPQMKAKPSKASKPKAKKPREKLVELPEEAILPDDWRAAPAEAGMTPAEMDETWDAMKRWANGANKDSTTVRRTERGWRNTWPTFWKGDLKKLRASRSNGCSASPGSGPSGWSGAAFSLMGENAHG